MMMGMVIEAVVIAFSEIVAELNECLRNRRWQS